MFYLVDWLIGGSCSQRFKSNCKSFPFKSLPIALKYLTFLINQEYEVRIKTCKEAEEVLADCEHNDALIAGIEEITWENSNSLIYII